jgi:uncharacterized protein (TIGR03000 family)
MYYSYPSTGYGDYYLPYENPYVAPLPGYAILPLPLASPNWRPERGWIGFGRDSTSDRGPRSRPTLYPAVPYEPTPSATDRLRARFEIGVPYANALVTFDGAKTKQAGLNRVFVTPPMEEGKEYTVTIAVQWMKEDGSMSTPRTKTFNVKAGQTIQHTFVE